MRASVAISRRIEGPPSERIEVDVARAELGEVLRKLDVVGAGLAPIVFVAR